MSCPVARERMGNMENVEGGVHFQQEIHVSAAKEKSHKQHIFPARLAVAGSRHYYDVSILRWGGGGDLGGSLQQAVALVGLLVGDVGDGVLVHRVEGHELALLEPIPKTLLACSAHSSWVNSRAI